MTVLEDIFDVPRGTLRESDSRDTIENWTSIADVQILTSITTEFGIEPDADLLQAETIGDLIAALESRNALQA